MNQEIVVMGRRYCLGIVVLLGASALVPAQRYYESSAAGMRVKPIADSRVSAYEYVLSIDDTDTGRTERLLKNGAEIRRVEYKTSGPSVEETTFESGVIVAYVKRENGRPVEERMYEAGKLSERTEYEYFEERLIGTATYDAEGTRIQSARYDRTDDGRLFRAQLSSDAGLRTSMYRFDSAHLYESWLGDDASTGVGKMRGILYRYHEGALVGIERWTSGTLERTETVETTATGSIRTIEDLTTGERTVMTYDNSGLLLEESAGIGEARISYTRYRYENRAVVESTTITSAGSEQHRYEYDEEGTVARELVLRDAILERVIVITGENERYEDIYRDGTAALRVYFSNDQKLREEDLR